MKKVIIGLSGALLLSLVVVLFANAATGDPKDCKKAQTEVSKDCSKCPDAASCAGKCEAKACDKAKSSEACAAKPCSAATAEAKKCDQAKPCCASKSK